MVASNVTLKEAFRLDVFKLPQSTLLLFYSFFIFIIDNFIMIHRIHVVTFCTVFSCVPLIFYFIFFTMQVALLTSLLSLKSQPMTGLRPCPATIVSPLAFCRSLYYRETDQCAACRTGNTATYLLKVEKTLPCRILSA